jgi:hypothetical protein
MLVAPKRISTFSKYALDGIDMRNFAVAANPASAAWPAANRALYIPFSIPFTFPVTALFWGNGSSAASNVDMGIFTRTFSRLVSTGSTAQSGTSAIQSVAASYTLPPGSYYFGITCSGTTNAIFANTSMTALAGRFMGLLQESSALPLPATMTPAQFAATIYPLCGMERAL